VSYKSLRAKNISSNKQEYTDLDLAEDEFFAEFEEKDENHVFPNKILTNSSKKAAKVHENDKYSSSEMQLSLILDQFVRLSQVDGGLYFLCDFESSRTVSNWLHSIPLCITDKFIFSTAPVNTRCTFSMEMLYKFAACYALGRYALKTALLLH